MIAHLASRHARCLELLSAMLLKVLHFSDQNYNLVFNFGKLSQMMTPRV